MTAPRLERLPLALLIWRHFALVVWVVRMRPLPEAVRRLGTVASKESGVTPARLSRAVDRALRLGRLQPRCLYRALVLYRLLQASGRSCELVIGLPETPVGPTAHAWVEVDGVDIGPAPGRAGHVELARYG